MQANNDPLSKFLFWIQLSDGPMRGDYYVTNLRDYVVIPKVDGGRSNFFLAGGSKNNWREHDEWLYYVKIRTARQNKHATKLKEAKRKRPKVTQIYFYDATMPKTDLAVKATLLAWERGESIIYPNKDSLGFQPF